MPKIKCKISEVIPLKKQKLNPILAHFQNGSISKENAAGMDVCLAEDTQANNASKVALAVSKDNVYDGYVGNGFPTDLVKTFIGIRKKDSNEIKLVEVNECTMLSYHYNSVAKRENKTYTGLTTDSAKRLLFKDFGGKKALKVFERKEKMKVNVDVVKDQLDKTLQEISSQKLEGEDKFDQSKIEQDQQLEQMVPKMNKEASKIGDVYQLTDLIEPEVLNSLDSAAVKLLKTTTDLPLTRKFLLNIIESIQRSKSPDDPDNLLKVKACIYIDALISYFTQISKVRQNSTVKLQSVSNIASDLIFSIKKKFSQPHINKTTKTNYVVHKTTCYIIVLSLLVSERYEMDIQNIVEEIGVAKTTLLKLIGCIAVRPKGKTNIISIRLPGQLKAFGTTFRKRRTL